MAENRLFDLDRFIAAQRYDYETALCEIRNGRKTSHWIWYIFPQVKGLGTSGNSAYYGILGLEEAKAYLAHPLLGARLREITEAMLACRGESARIILGDIDALKLCSSMTLFDLVCPNDIFAEVLNEFYDGRRCHRTLQIINR